MKIRGFGVRAELLDDADAGCEWYFARAREERTIGQDDRGEIPFTTCLDEGRTGSTEGSLWAALGQDDPRVPGLPSPAGWSGKDADHAKADHTPGTARIGLFLFCQVPG
jgi:hypothetical protein